MSRFRHFTSCRANNIPSASGQADSPAHIVITKISVKRNEVQVVTKKGQKAEVKKTGKIVEYNTNYEIDA